jgi:hypothetical protein
MTSETNVIRFDWIIVESIQMIVLKTLRGGDEPPLFFSQLSCSFQLPQVRHIEALAYIDSIMNHREYLNCLAVFPSHAGEA